MPRWSNGRIAGFQSAAEGSIPSLATDNRTWRSLVSRLAGSQEIVGSIPTVLTDNRAEVQMEARLLWEQEGFGSTPKRPTDLVVEGWLPKWP